MSHASATSVPQPYSIGQKSYFPGVLTREARIYAIKELVRRAGVSADFFNTWRMEFSARGTTIYVLPGTRKRVFFPDAPREIWTDLIHGHFFTCRLGWLNEPGIPSVENAVVPFVHGSQAQSRALFCSTESETIECTVDLPFSALLLLSRWEERLVEQRDNHGRIPAKASIAYQEGFLRRPVVDEYGLAFRQALESLIPNWKPSLPTLRVNISHDVDNIGLPFNFRQAIGHTFRRHNPLATLKDFLSVFPGINPTLLDSIRELVNLSLRRGLEPAVYWKGTNRLRRPTDYDPYHSKVRAMIEWLQKHKLELGVHPSYGTFRCPDKLRREVQTVRGLIGGGPLGGRQDYLRWSPDSWLDWENCGLVYDSTVGYADQVGFRAGTCVPYYPWLFALNRPARVLEMPLIIMDCTLTWYMGLNAKQAFAAVSECIDQCRKVGGVFTLLWHNDSMLNPALDGMLIRLLDSLNGYRKYDPLHPAADLY